MYFTVYAIEKDGLRLIGWNLSEKQALYFVTYWADDYDVVQQEKRF